MGFVPENQVRTRLPAGGRRIRTIGPSRVESICLDTVLPPGAVEKACSEKHSTLGGPAVRISFPPQPPGSPNIGCPLTGKGQIEEFSGTNNAVPASVELVEPLRRAAIEGELLGL